MIESIARDIAVKGGRCFYVGGYVRDLLMGQQPLACKDIDIEVFDVNQEELLKILAGYGKVQQVGRSYPVFKISGHYEWDLTVAPVTINDIQKACMRRDFTVNAIMMEVLSGTIYDPLGGRDDIAKRIIRHTNREVFQADPLRVYRAVQMAARFEFVISPDTMELIRHTNLVEVNNERVYGELHKLLLLSSQPSRGLRYMQEGCILKKKHIQLYNLVGCRQDPRTHPEGDVWEHTLLVVDQAARLKAQSQNPEVLMFAALLHDLGKPATTRQEKGKIISYGHDQRGEILARDFLRELTRNKKLINEVSLLVKEHMNPILLYKQKDRVSNKAIRKLINRVNLQELLLLSEADFLGRSIDRDYSPIREWFARRTEELGLKLDGGIDPLVTGRDLIAMGYMPGPQLGIILNDAFELQLEGKGKEEILKHIQAAWRLESGFTQPSRNGDA